jgi:hypothetical protein
MLSEARSIKSEAEQRHCTIRLEGRHGVHP